MFNLEITLTNFGEMVHCSVIDYTHCSHGRPQKFPEGGEGQAQKIPPPHKNKKASHIREKSCKKPPHKEKQLAKI